MGNFKNFKSEMQKQFDRMVKTNNVLYLTNVDKDLIYETYLAAFPEGTNEIYRERNAHDCNACKQFLRPYGNIVAIENNKLVSIWDFDMPDFYKEVASKLSDLVKSKPIKEVFVSKFQKLGIDSNKEIKLGVVKTWEHFYFKLPIAFVNKNTKSIESVKADFTAAKEVFKRSLEEISVDSIETTLDLILQKAIYRGEESKYVVSELLKHKKIYIELSDNEKDNYAWNNSIKYPAIAKIRNHAIGTLLVDLSKDKEINIAVAFFEHLMAPQNYKRTSAIITKNMITNAQSKIAEMGFEDSLGRRFANIDDISMGDILHANHESKIAMNVFDELKQELPANQQKLTKIDEVTIEDFIKNILPNSTSLEILLENKHENNFLSLIAPKIKDSKSLFKWNNSFSWAYNGDVTDSIKERVKRAGGNVNGVLRTSLSWFNYDDLDIHVIEPNNNEIYYRHQHSNTTGFLDVDMNANGSNTRKGVENITWTNKNKMLEGTYKVIINNFNKRENQDFGFDVEMEYDGKLYNFNYSKLIPNNHSIPVVEFKLSKTKGIEIINSLKLSSSSKEIWNLNTNTFHKVSLMLNSPNFWENTGSGIGNKHYFFILENCKNPTTPRGFFNEFLNEKLMKERKVFDVLGSKMKVENSDEQLSGIGFSSTKKNSITCKVKGNFTRTIKIIL
jgi:hypothetical protein